MEYISIGDNEYYFEKGYRDNIKLRKSFNELAKKTFYIDFEKWYSNGYWTNKYIPYSIVYKDKIIANASVNLIYFNIFGEEKLCIQIGTVMTEEYFRGRGLSRFLIEKIIGDWKDKAYMIYLFANSSVLDFYPKFGFVEEKEYIFYKFIDHNLNENYNKLKQKSFEKLNMDIKENRDFVCKKILSSSINSPLNMVRNPDLIMFYCEEYMKDNVYYIEDMQSIVVAEIEDNSLIIYAVWRDLEINLDEIISRFTDESVEKVILGFTPKNSSAYECKLYLDDDTTLFVLDGSRLFRENRIKFETLSHA